MTCNNHRRDEKCIQILTGKPKGKESYGDMDTAERDLQEIGCEVYFEFQEV
jgi:hypothetical protein